MYKSFRMKNFRCFDDLEIKGFKRVNLIAGLNNVGKTALLEAMWLHCGRKPELTLSLNSFRGIEPNTVQIGPAAEALWDPLFADFDLGHVVEFSGTDTNCKRHVIRLKGLKTQEELSKLRNALAHGKGDETERSPLASGPAQVLELSYIENEKCPQKYHMIIDSNGLRTDPIPPALPFQSVFLASQYPARVPDLADLFSKLEIAGKQDDLVVALREVEPRLTRLALAKSGGLTLIHGAVGLSRLIPLNFMGEGTLKLARILLFISTSPKGIVLIDEIENGFHHSILPKVWQVLAKAARDYDTQLFATTHSLECISSAHETFLASKPYEFQLYRLDNVKGKIRVVSYDRDTLSAAIESETEVR